MKGSANFDDVPRDLLEAWEPEGDFTRIHMLNPVLFDALGNVQGQRILDAGCGQGYLCRLLAKKGASMVGVEPSRTMYEFAIEKEGETPLGVQYIHGDLNAQDLGGPFDVVIANMVLIDISDWELAMRNCVDVLRAGGSFIYSIVHPCFEESADQWPEKRFVAVEEYLAEFETPMTYGVNFHRTLSSYVNKTIELGCHIKKMIEPGVTHQVAAAEGPAAERLVHVPGCLVVVAGKI